MVRINLVKPKQLADQHLIAEYDEILMLLGYAERYPEIKDTPNNYKLGRGHMKFFKNKILYLKKRHEEIKKEMKKRGFKTNKTINIKKYEEKLLNDWKPRKEDYIIIKERIIEKINKKPEYYRYKREKKPKEFFIKLIKRDDL